MKDLVILVLVANVIAIPVGYWAKDKWLESSAYRIALHPLVFVVATGAFVLIASLIARINASRVAMQNP